MKLKRSSTQVVIKTALLSFAPILGIRTAFAHFPEGILRINSAALQQGSKCHKQTP
jgi:hypothetical protein